jgi:hypothetical protein
MGSLPVAPHRSRSRGRAIGLSLRIDESLPFVLVHVLRPVPYRPTHLEKTRPGPLQPPGADRESGNAQSSRDLDIGQGSLLRRRERTLQSYNVVGLSERHGFLQFSELY